MNMYKPLGHWEENPPKHSYWIIQILCDLFCQVMIVYPHMKFQFSLKILLNIVIGSSRFSVTCFARLWLFSLMKFHWSTGQSSYSWSSHPMASFYEGVIEDPTGPNKSCFFFYSLARYVYELARRHRSVPTGLVLNATGSQLRKLQNCCKPAPSTVCFLNEVRLNEAVKSVFFLFFFLLSCLFHSQALDGLPGKAAEMSYLADESRVGRAEQGLHVVLFAFLTWAWNIYLRNIFVAVESKCPQ